jgi:hypothetical protein
MKTTINGTTLRVWRLPNWAARVVRWWWGPATADQHDAFTVGHTVFLVSGELTDNLLVHESVHAKNVERIRAPWPLDALVFLVRYAAENRRAGYAFNKYELEARVAQRRFIEETQAG